jgi:hypothetical protein
VDGQNVVVVRNERRLVAGTRGGGADESPTQASAYSSTEIKFFRETTDLETAEWQAKYH